VGVKGDKGKTKKKEEKKKNPKYQTEYQSMFFGFWFCFHIHVLAYPVIMSHHINFIPPSC
jgi:lipopolysaccharide export LptBFGC system permease protein LptF